MRDPRVWPAAGLSRHASVLRLTTWYYALGIDAAMHRVPARYPEQLLCGDVALTVDPRPEWVRDGAVMLFGVLVALRERQPWAFMGWGGGLIGVGPSSEPSRPILEVEEIDRCTRLARTAGRRAGVAPKDVPSLTAFLIGHGSRCRSRPSRSTTSTWASLDSCPPGRPRPSAGGGIVG
jgi:hypothetical protein